ncbi:MAG TPA: phosphoglycerate dehydrogenase [Chloroflexota bacterium]|jgi:D-3-phosphoglycerate dehydrogenase|nr:phosphoglycerate dehydrogenase [Chloroflexota bacterium]
MSTTPAPRPETAPRVLVTDPIAPDGIAYLRQHAQVDVLTERLPPAALAERIGAYAALVVRSETKVTREVIEAGRNLRVIGRAGVGVDNIDVEAATRRGVVVVNAPAGNTIAVAEHTLGLLLALARSIPQAAAALRRGEWQRSKYLGHEIRGKILGIIGLGRIGRAVARRAQGFEMRTIAYDPYVGAEQARRLGVELVELPALLRTADFVSIHTPATAQTQGLLGAAELALMKPTAYLINCARGGIVDEAALTDALRSGRLAGAALDVFSREPPGDLPLLQLDNVVATPHLAASTHEAQVSVALEVAEQVVAVLNGQPALYAVNAPAVPPEVYATLGPYLRLCTMLGQLATQLADGQHVSVEVTYSGEIAEQDTAVLQATVIRGLLAPISEEPVNLVNAPLIARQRGLRVVERKTPATDNYTNLIAVALRTDRGERVVAGTVIHGEPHIVSIDGYSVDLTAQGGYVLLSRHVDRPGIIGKVGTLLGEADINISSMQVGRQRPRGEALMALTVDEPIPPELLERIRSVADIEQVRLVRL